ncbi:serine/threonine-protein kinase [Nocardiopsis tropica]|uniref:Serine/threonine-protein kinase n=1 Tax=Nocardiopsis tropica TaxID=109330 RepID=A0ABV1ZS00_9ACTN
MSPARPSASLPATATNLLPQDPASVGPYTPLKRLGAGGMGVVYAARADDGELVAVKVVHPEYAADPEFRDRFAREVEMLSRVGGACAVPLLAADTRGEQPWLATPLIRGLTLSAYLKENGGPLPEGLQYGLAVGIAEALAQIHASGVVHRDLKPANIILSPEGPRVLDFGIARALDQTALTRTGSLLGSAGWISPAHYRGEPISTADDVFAWGALVAYAATGRPPFGGGDPAAVAHRVLSGEPDMEGFSGPLADLARRALSKDAGRRPGALALVTGVMAAANLGGTPVTRPQGAGDAVATTLHAGWHGVHMPQEREVTVPRRTSRGRRSGAWSVLAVAAALFLLAGAAVGGAAVAGNWDSLPLAAWFDGGPAEATGSDDGPSGGERRSGAAVREDGEDPSPSEEPAAGASDDAAGAGEDGSGGGGETATATAVVGAGVGASGSQPSGDHVVAFQPSGGSARYALLDGATVLCAWSFCQDGAGAVGDGEAGTVSSSPSALTGYVNQGSRTIRAEVTYTTADDGTVTITRLVERHRAGGSGTPPW